MFPLINHLINNVAYILAAAFLFTRVKSTMEERFHRTSKEDHLLYIFFFTALSIAGTYIGLDYQGAILNTRNIGVITAGLLMGPEIGLITAFFAALHRLSIPLGSLTALPCALATLVAGVFSGFCHRRYKEKHIAFVGFLLAILVESLSMLFILVLNDDFSVALALVKKIYLPMSMMNSVGVYVLILTIQSMLDSMDARAGRQAKMALDIANKTLPLFRQGASLDLVCQVILDSLEAKAVVITDLQKIRASATAKGIPNPQHSEIKSHWTKQVLESGRVMVFGKAKEEDVKDFIYLSPKIRSCIILPLFDQGTVSGSLKIFFDSPEQVTAKKYDLAIGLSQVISGQLELEKIKELEDTARNAELKALYSQINPHFLFNVLNTIASFIRMDPQKAREVIIDLSVYLRYNMENTMKFVSLEEEMKQVQAFVSIEQARYGEKLSWSYDIAEETKSIQIPSLSIQPLVENSIIHGILPKRGGGSVSLRTRMRGEEMEVCIADSGLGMPQEVIDSLEGSIGQSIGLKNVHHRLCLLYGKGLEIKVDEEGTKVYFYVPKV